MAITASMVKELREMTGAGMMDCKKALNETNGDMDAAVEFLRKNGQAKAEKMGKKILLPVDAVTIKDFPDPIDGPVETEVCDITAMPADREGLSPWRRNRQASNHAA